MSAAELTKDGAMVIDEATKFSGLGRTVLYGMIRDKKIATVKIGRRRLVLKSELQRILAANLDAAAK